MIWRNIQPIIREPGKIYEIPFLLERKSKEGRTGEENKRAGRPPPCRPSSEMSTIPFGVSSFPTSNVMYGSFGSYFSLHFSDSFASTPRFRVSTSPSTAASRSGVCKASQTLEFFPSIQPEVVVREARLEDCWEVAETHCSSFFPNYAFPLDLALRINRLMVLLSGFSVPDGCMRTCLVAVIGNSFHDNFLGIEGFKVGCFEGKGSVTGILTIDTLADFLPRKGPLRQRRKGIAYISNVAVRKRDRCKGIAKKLVAKAESVARSWGCRAIALHCDASNLAAVRLYLGQGFRCVKVPDHANWPKPKTSPGIQFNFMMKLVTSCTPTSMT